jgi:hypothetical protein
MRFSKILPEGPPGEDRKVIEHFWLCGKCAELYVLEYEAENGLVLKPRNPVFSETNHSHFAAAS